MFKINLLYKFLISVVIGLLLFSCGSSDGSPKVDTGKPNKNGDSSNTGNIIPIKNQTKQKNDIDETKGCCCSLVYC